MLKIVENRIEHFDKHIKEVENELLKKSLKRGKYFTNFMIGQFALLHYLIYFNLSWDIMEPVTVILANIDILLAYYYFVMKGNDYSLETIQQKMIQSKKYKYLAKHGINV